MSTDIPAGGIPLPDTAPRHAAARRGPAVRRGLTNSALYLAMLVVVVFFVFPLLWVLSMSLKSPDELFTSPPDLLPKAWEWSNYSTVLQQTPLIHNTVNSLIIVGCTMIGAVALSVLSAYGTSRFAFRLNRAYQKAILTAQMISPVVLVVALYPTLVDLRLLNSYVSLVLVYIAVTMPFLAWFLHSYFETIPRELDGAAMVDGCSRLKAFWTVILPAARPGVASAAVLAAVMSWSQFVVPFIMLDKSSLFPISVGVLNLQSTGGSITLQYVAAGSVIAVLPVVIIFVVFQRWILSALTQGAVKG